MQGITCAGRGFEGMKEAELQVLEQARVQAGRVARLRAKCSVIVSKGAYKSPALTGMPGSGHEPCGLDGGRRECEALLEELEREEGAMKRLAAKGEKIIARSSMKAEMKEFCRRYYLRRMSVEEAAESVGVTGRTGWNYKADVEAARRPKKQGHTRKNEAKMDRKNFQ